MVPCGINTKEHRSFTTFIFLPYTHAEFHFPSVLYFS